MTIAERINLHRCGYSRSEIEQLAAAEKAEVETVVADVVTTEQPVQETTAAQPVQETTAAQPAETNNDAVLSAIKELTKAIYAQNINRSEQPKQQPMTVDDLITKI